MPTLEKQDQAFLVEEIAWIQSTGTKRTWTSEIYLEASHRQLLFELGYILDKRSIQKKIVKNKGCVIFTDIG